MVATTTCAYPAPTLTGTPVHVSISKLLLSRYLDVAALNALVCGVTQNFC